MNEVCYKMIVFGTQGHWTLRSLIYNQDQLGTEVVEGDHRYAFYDEGASKNADSADWCKTKDMLVKSKPLTESVHGKRGGTRGSDRICVSETLLDSYLTHRSRSHGCSLVGIVGIVSNTCCKSGMLQIGQASPRRLCCLPTVCLFVTLPIIPHYPFPFFASLQSR